MNLLKNNEKKLSKPKNAFQRSSIIMKSAIIENILNKQINMDDQIILKMQLKDQLKPDDESESSDSDDSSVHKRE